MSPLRAWTGRCSAKDRRPYHCYGGPTGRSAGILANFLCFAISTDRTSRARDPTMPYPTQPYRCTCTSHTIKDVAAAHTEDGPPSPLPETGSFTCTLSPVSEISWGLLSAKTSLPLPPPILFLCTTFHFILPSCNHPDHPPVARG
jgi:hypothetical protein